jgi:septal ring factor EnvC (AmiA/AmiB activator)
VINCSLDEAQGEESRLRSKQGRQVQFKSKAERDKAITQEIEQVQQLLKRKDHLFKDMTSKAKDLETQIRNIESETLELRSQLDGRKETIDQLTRECRDAEEEKAKLDDERRYNLIPLLLNAGNFGDLKQRLLLKKIVQKRNSEKLNSNYTTPWTEMFKLVLLQRPELLRISS